MDEDGILDKHAQDFFNDAFEAGYDNRRDSDTQREQSIETSRVEDIDGIEFGPREDLPTGKQQRLSSETGHQDVSINNQTLIQRSTDYQAQSFAEDPSFKEYLKLALRSKFRLPHKSIHYSDHAEVRELLSPLIKELPLTIRLIHSLLYALIPSCLQIVEVCSSNIHDRILDIELVENFAAIIRQTAESRILLVLGNKNLKTLFILNMIATSLSIIKALPSLFSEWNRQYINVRLYILLNFSY
jgi:hypothetical protein